MDWIALGVAVALCLSMAGAEALFSASDLPQWLGSLKRPRLYAPLWVWILAAIATYLIQGFVAYRLVARGLGGLDLAALAVLVCAMAANVGYNVVLGRTRRPRHAFLGIVWFLPPLAVLQGLLFATDMTAALVHLVYAVWVIAYDLPIMHRLWRLNEPPVQGG
jgi:tryptophan-rich sensory protein